MWPQISGILDFGFWGFWILGIWDFGLWGFWILDFGPLCSKSLCEAPNAPSLGIWNFGFWGFWILDFEVWGMEKFGCKIRHKFWILHKSKKTVHAAPGRRIILLARTTRRDLFQINFALFWVGWIWARGSILVLFVRGSIQVPASEKTNFEQKKNEVKIPTFTIFPTFPIQVCFPSWDLGIPSWCQEVGGFVCSRFSSFFTPGDPASSFRPRRKSSVKT